MLESLSAEMILHSLLFTLAGLVVHVLKKSVNKGINPLNYLKLYKGRTAASVGTIFTSYATVLVMEPGAGPEAFFAIGYVLDSMINKAPSAEEVDHGEGVRMKVDLDEDGVPDSEQEAKKTEDPDDLG